MVCVSALWCLSQHLLSYLGFSYLGHGVSLHGCPCPCWLPLCKVLWRTSRQKHAQEKLPLAQGQGQWPRGATARPRSGAAAENARLRWHRSAREELPNGRGQEWRPRGATPCPRSGGCAGAGGPRGATPRSRSGGAAVRSYPSSKVYSVIQFKVKGPVPCMHLEPEGYSLH